MRINYIYDMKLPAPNPNRLEPSIPRILAAISHVIRTAQSKGARPTQYEIVKTLFLADRAHLNRFGRPITYDNYFAMKDGPVPSFAYDLLKESAQAIGRLPNQRAPWSRQPIGPKVSEFFDATYDADEDLSESDMEVLEAALATVMNLTFRQIRKLTHEDKAYVDAWRDDGQSKSFAMQFGLLFDDPDPERAEQIIAASKSA